MEKGKGKAQGNRDGLVNMKENEEENFKKENEEG